MHVILFGSSLQIFWVQNLLQVVLWQCMCRNVCSQIRETLTMDTQQTKCLKLKWSSWKGMCIITVKGHIQPTLLEVKSNMIVLSSQQIRALNCNWLDDGSLSFTKWQSFMPIPFPRKEVIWLWKEIWNYLELFGIQIFIFTSVWDKPSICPFVWTLLADL